MVETDNTWYVAICKCKDCLGEFYSLVGAGGESYKGFSELAQRRGVTVVAEQFEVTDAVIDKLDGFDESGKRISEGLLAELARRLNQGEQFDVQKELTELCQTA